ncbi:hypothetical protein O0L34_g14626 [Tuta absoluta]|nr:hypothetical protein O0L34_g14626 [Tuta absoluta]
MLEHPCIMKTFFVLALLILGCSAHVRQNRKFPDDFLFGVATAAYQIEGGWDADDKGENIWDHLVHNHPQDVKDGTNGDVGADTYHNYKRDVEMMREMGLDAYRFSLAWSRILPTGFSNQVSEAGVAFYNNYIDEMLKYNITPMVTLYHWDLPQKLQDLGGFTNSEFPQWFEDYARVVFKSFGDRVKHFITFNEPREICFEGYGGRTKAPQVNAHGIAEYLCAKTLVIGHANAYHAYNKDFKPEQKGVCGITISVNWFGAATDSEEDEFAAELRRQGDWGMYAEPIFSKDGGFPKELSERVAQKSKEQGFSRSRMPEFTDEEKDLVRGAFDFFGVNHYTSNLISATEQKSSNNVVPGLMDDIDVGSYALSEWPQAASSWLYLAPNSIYNAVNHLRNKYGNLTFYITENGWSQSPSGGLVDDDRIAYIRASLESMLNCLDDGIQLKGYMPWTLMDNWEWLEGLTERFGLYHVDFEDPARTRTARKSALVYKQVIKTRTIDYSYNPEDLTISIDDGY